MVLLMVVVMTSKASHLHSHSAILCALCRHIRHELIVRSHRREITGGDHAIEHDDTRPTTATATATTTTPAATTPTCHERG